jgi:hypothetical protein
VSCLSIKPLQIDERITACQAPHLLCTCGVIVATRQLSDALQRRLTAPADAQQALHV